MLLLAIDTSGKQGSIALARAGETSGDDNDIELIESLPLTGGTFSAQLIPQIAGLLSAHGLTKNNIDAFAVGSGPGSFTGIRIGLAAVKALAEVLSKPIAAISLLEACACASQVQGKIMTALDAGRGDVYVRQFELPAVSTEFPRELMLTRKEFLELAKDWKIVTPEHALAELATSSGISVITLSPITAVEVARLGWQKIRRGVTVTPAQLEANYIRRTDAEMIEQSGA